METFAYDPSGGNDEVEDTNNPDPKWSGHQYYCGGPRIGPIIFTEYDADGNELRTWREPAESKSDEPPGSDEPAFIERPPHC